MPSSCQALLRCRHGRRSGRVSRCSQFPSRARTIGLALFVGCVALVAAQRSPREILEEYQNGEDEEIQMPRGPPLGYVKDAFNQESEEPLRMSFGKGTKPNFETQPNGATDKVDDDGNRRCSLEPEEEEFHGDFHGDKKGFSVAKVERFLKILEPIKDPLKALFGIGLLFHGRSFAHLILFTQAFKVTGFPILAQAASRMAVRYEHFLKGQDKETVNPIKLLLATIDPDALSLLFQGLYSGLVGCVASVVSPIAGATGIGLAIGSTIDEHIQPLLRRFVAARWTKWRLLRDVIGPQWTEYAVATAPKSLGVAGALLTMRVVNIMSGALLGAQLLVQVLVRHLEIHLRRFARRSNHVLLQKAACNFNPQHSAVGGLTFALATSSFLAQLRRNASMSLFSRVLLGLPLLLEKTLAELKWALLARRLS